MNDTVDITRGTYRRIYSNFVHGRRINAVSLKAEAWFWRVQAIADDFGNTPGEGRQLWLATVGRRDITQNDVELLVEELVRAGLLRRYQVADDTYMHITFWNDETWPCPRNGRRARKYPPPPWDVVHPGASGCIQVHPGESGCIQVHPGESGCIQVHPGESGCIQGSPGESGGVQGSPGESGGVRVHPGESGGIRVHPGESGCIRGNPGASGCYQDHDHDQDQNQSQNQNQNDAARLAATRKPRRQPPEQRIGWSKELGFSGIAEQNRKVWNDAYPSANIDAELAKAHAWLIAHPDRAGKRNWAAFLTRWLGRAHEGASVRGARQGAATLARIGDGSYASERVKIRRLDAGGEGAGESGTH